MGDPLTQAVTTIVSRFLLPYEEKIRPVCKRGEDFNIVIDTATLQDYAEEDINVAEKAIQVLQNISMWEALRKSIIRYVAEDSYQRRLFNKFVDSIGK